MQRPSRTHIYLALIVFLGLFLRFFGLRQDLPYSHHIDEIGVIYDSLKMGSGDLDPHCFYYPTLWYYILLGAYGAYYLLGHVLGIFATAADFVLLYLKDPTVFFLIGRSLSALMSTLLIAITYRLCRMLYDRATGLIAAFFVAVSPLLVEYSHYTIVDVPMTTALFLAFLPLASLLARPRLGYYIASGAIIGCATAIKYPALAALCPLIAAHLLSRDTTKRGGIATLLSPRLAFGVCAVILFFLAACPWPILDSKKFFEDIVFQRKLALVQWPGWGSEKLAFSYFAFNVLPKSSGITVFLAAFAGIVGTLMRKERAGIMLLSFLVPYVTVFFLSRMPHEHFMMPAMPIIAIFAAVFLHRLVSTKKGKGILIAALALLFAFPALQDSIALCRSFLLKNTAVASAEWIKGHVAPGTKIFLAADVPLPFSTSSISRIHNEKRKARSKYKYREKTDWFFELQERLANDRIGFDIEEMPQLFYVGLRAEGDFIQEWVDIDKAREIFSVDRYDYIVDNFTVEQPFLGARGKRVPRQYAFIREFFEELQKRTPVKTFAPEPGKYRGKIVKIYKIRNGN